MPRAASTSLSTDKPVTLQCFKPGRHVPLSGAALEFAQSDLAATAGAYDPQLHEAPLVVGHPKTDSPAYGHVKALAFAGGALEATPHQVNPEFAALVNAGTYKKMSAAFWAPDAPGNPVPGVYYLRHIGFLGGAAPAVAGLRTPQFAGDERGIVEFAEWDDVDNAGLWRALRDWVLGKFGQADADTAVPGYLVANVERGAQAELAKANAPTTAAGFAPAFAQPHLKTEPTVTDAEKLARAEAENARLRKQIDDAATAQRKACLDAANADAVAFAQGLVDNDQLPTGDSAILVSAFNAVAAQEVATGSVVEFSQGETTAPLLPALKKLLQALPKRVATGRVATAAARAGATPLDVNDPNAIAFAAQDYQEEQRKAGRPGVPISVAVQHVIRQAGGESV